MGSNFKLYNDALLRLIACALVSAVALSAEMEMPAGVFRGTLAASQDTAAAGDLTLQSTQGIDLVCHYDAHSYAERDHHRVPMSSITRGETVEILADNKLGSQACYARMVLVIDPAAESARQRQISDPVRPFFFTPKGDRTVAGMVVRVTSRFLMLKTRTGEATLMLRPDTRYLAEGMRAEPADLRVNTRVFVRAGRTLDGIVEAYQVIWGTILPMQ